MKDQVSTKAEKDAVLAATIVKGLGGLGNITDVDNCITRLRVEVKNGSLVDEDVLKWANPVGIVTSGRGVQVIYGPRATAVANALRAYLQNPVEVDLDASQAAAAEVSAAPARVPTVVRAPLAGEVIPLSAVEDKAFAAGMVGPGLAIRPTRTASQLLVSPVDGEVILVFRTKHAIGIKSDTGVELLVHVGLDTVKLKGEGFETLVEKGDIVQAGTPLMRFDPAIIEAAGYKLTTPIIVTNATKVGDPLPVAGDIVKQGNGLFVVL
ncbi:MAG: glucose PTS transporter subunit IIA [Micrococcales bacterium]|nr:glucose PTS transporter subunit IIA [Micrococcales bacterium]